MQEQSLFVDYPMPRISAGGRWRYFLKRAITGRERFKLEYDYIIRNAKFSLKTPFYNFAASKMYLDQALALNPSDWTVWANLATISLFEGDETRGIMELKRAASLKGRPLDVGDRGNTPHLLDAIKLRGISPSSLSGS